MLGDRVLRVIAKLLIPFILVFGLYVQFHGDFGPGGGFQAGVIIAAAIIFHALIYDLPTTQRIVPEWVIETLIAVGIVIYAGVGIVCMLMGGGFLDYSVLEHDPVHGQHLGIFLVELGVAATVSGVMLMIFYMFAGRSRTSRSEK
jgi:multicomponent Na+:H+ antiporter subunit B